MVDDADPFQDVLQRVVTWLQERELGTKYKYAILTDGYVLDLLILQFEPSLSLSPCLTVAFAFALNLSFLGPGI